MCKIKEWKLLVMLSIILFIIAAIVVAYLAFLAFGALALGVMSIGVAVYNIFLYDKKEAFLNSISVNTKYIISDKFLIPYQY